MTSTAGCSCTSFTPSRAPKRLGPRLGLHCRDPAHQRHPPLAQKDPDAALAAAGRDAQDWEGGTRIGEALRRFNVDWSRRVLGQGAVVLLITDGLERGDTTALEREMERLRLSCGKVIWLNPLLRWDGFAPKAAGIRRSCHMWTASMPAIRSQSRRPLDGPSHGREVTLKTLLCVCRGIRFAHEDYQCGLSLMDMRGDHVIAAPAQWLCPRSAITELPKTGNGRFFGVYENV